MTLLAPDMKELVDSYILYSKKKNISREKSMLFLCKALKSCAKIKEHENKLRIG